ncbi:MAG: hypothetical protein LBU64_01380 [Planctomycetota bacterium]|jgi:DNA-binding transcriptional regulator LsrR (DeoR family)|nr:hypothetical protein [Planctomycetota bacterium]
MADETKQAARPRLLYEIARMYYCLDLPQKEIARRTSFSRAHISRLLKQAREEGIVEIKLNYFGERSSFGETVIGEAFGLANIRVYNCDGISLEEVHKAICCQAAGYVESILKPRQVIGITRGSIIAGMIQEFKGSRRLDLKVVQLMGADAAGANIGSVPDLIRKMVDLFGGTASYLDAPLYVENDIARNNLIQEAFLSRQMKKARSAEIILTSIRPLYKGLKRHIWTGFIGDREIGELLNAGAVGYILARAFDRDGRLVDHPVNRRIIGMEPAELREKNVIAVAYDKDYAQAVLGALRGGYVKTLITDSACADEVIAIMENDNRGALRLG